MWKLQINSTIGKGQLILEANTMEDLTTLMSKEVPFPLPIHTLRNIYWGRAKTLSHIYRITQS